VNEDHSVALAQWLQEVGRRRARYRRRATYLAPRPGPRREACHLRSALLLLAASAAVAQYCYADTMLGILSIRSVLVFVFTGGPQ